MSLYTPQKAQLPPSELGEDRNFQIGYYGHGDISIATWTGPLDPTPSVQDEAATWFGLHHGRDVLIFASLAGYLKRLGRSDEVITQMMHEAGADILSDDLELLRYHDYSAQRQVARIADGTPVARFDVPAMALACLVIPAPIHPGLIQMNGGTGIYTRNIVGGEPRLVFGQIPSGPAQGEAVFPEPVRTADFCEQDVPVMARLVCEVALGEYRRDIQAFLTGANELEEF